MRILKIGRLLAAMCVALFASLSAARALDCSAVGYVQAQGGYYKAVDHSGPYSLDSNCNPASVASAFSASSTNPATTLTMTSATTAYSAGQLIATSATANAVVNPSFTIANSAGGAAIPRVRLSTNDTTSTAWGGVSVQVDLWTASPTWTNGDRLAWSPATGAASHLASFSCTMSPEYGDGAFAECAPTVGTFADVRLASGSNIYWSLKAVTASGVTGVSKIWTLVPELMN